MAQQERECAAFAGDPSCVLQLTTAHSCNSSSGGSAASVLRGRCAHMHKPMHRYTQPHIDKIAKTKRSY